MTTIIYERATELLEAELADELLALDTQGGKCFGFNSVAATVWRHLQQPRSLQELTAHLLEEYDVSVEECARDLQEHLDELLAGGLVRTTSQP